MEKKANKFVYSIAKKLVESEGCHKVPRQKLLQLFENVIKSMPKKDPLKTELQRNIATYTNKLDRCIAKKQAALGKETSRSPSNGQKDEAEGKDEEEEETREEEEDVSEYPINLYANGGFVRAVEHLERTKDTKLGVLLLSQAHLADDGVDERIEHVMVKNMKKLSIGKSPMQQVEDRIQLYRKEMMILVGNRELKPLMQCLNRFHKNMTPEVEGIIEKKQVECGKKLQEFFLDFLSFARFQFGQIAQKESVVPSYEYLIAAIMALFIDLSIFLSRGQSKSASHYGKKALSRLQLLLGHAPLSILYVLLQLSEPGQQDAEFMMPIYKKVLRQVGDTSCPYYCSFVIASRQACELLQFTYAQECSNILQTCHSMKVPHNILLWLSDRTPQIVESLPTKVKKDVNKLASYLLRDATEDTCDALLDGMSLVVDKSKEEEMEEEKEEQEELFFVDTSKHTQTPDAGDGAPLFFTDTSLHTESSESDTSKALKHSINSLIIGLDSDNKQDKSSSDESSNSEDEDEVITAVKKKRQAKVSSIRSTSIGKSGTGVDQDMEEDEPEEESEEEESEKEQDGDSENEQDDRRRTRQQSSSSQQRRRPAIDQKEDSSDEDMEVDESEEDQIEKEEGEEASSDEGVDDESDGKDEDQEDDEEEASDREQSNEEQVDDQEEEDASDREQSDEDQDEEQKSEDENDQDKDVQKSPTKISVGRQQRLSPRGKKGAVDLEEKHQENDAVQSTRMRRNTRQSKVGESITSNTDESFRTCDDMDEKDVFFEADDSIFFKNTSPVKTPPSKKQSRTFLGTTPNTYLSQSTRRSTRLRQSESKREPNQTTLDKFFLSQPAKSVLSPSGEEVIIIPETQMSGEDDDEISKTAELASKTTSRRLSRRLIVKKVDKSEGTESPVFELTESQLSNTTPQPYAHVVPESDDGDVQKYQEKQLEDIVIQGIKKIKKSSSPSLEDVVTQGIKKIRKSTSQPQSPKRHSPRKSHGGGKGKHHQGQEQEIGSLTPPSSPIPLVVVEVNGSLIGSKKDISNEHVSTTVHNSGKKETAMMKSKTQLSTSPRTHKVSSKDCKTQVTSTSSSKAKHASASKVTSPPSAKKAAADFGNVYRMMAGIGLSQESQASSLEDFQLPSTSKKSPLQPKVLLEKFPIDDSNQLDVKDKDGTVNVDSVKGLRSRTVSESEMSEASVSSIRRSSRRRNVEQSTTQVMGKPPIPQTSSRRGLRTATSCQGNRNEVHHTSEDEPSSPPRSRRRSKRNSESSVASEASMPKSPQRRQKVIQTNKKSLSSVKHAAVSNKTNSKEFPSVPLTCPARIRRSKRISESSADGEQPSTSKKSRNFRSILAIPRIDSSQESGIYPLHSSLSSEEKQSELVDPASSPVQEDVDNEFEHTLRSRTVSGGSSQDDESIMGSQESFTVTQFLRRDRDRRNRKYASRNGDGDVGEKEGAGPKKTSQSSEKKRLSLSQGPSSTSRSRTRRKSSQKK